MLTHTAGDTPAMAGAGQEALMKLFAISDLWNREGNDGSSIAIRLDEAQGLDKGHLQQLPSCSTSPERRGDLGQKLFAVPHASGLGRGNEASSDERALAQQRTRLSPHPSVEVPQVATAVKWKSFGEVEEAKTKGWKNKHLRSAGALWLTSACRERNRGGKMPERLISSSE